MQSLASSLKEGEHLPERLLYLALVNSGWWNLAGVNRHNEVQRLGIHIQHIGIELRTVSAIVHDLGVVDLSSVREV